ncbi:kelch-like protein 18 [Haemaphysalis longicornis]
MKAAGDAIDHRSRCEDIGAAATSARQLFSYGGRQHNNFAPVVARSMPMLKALRRARKYYYATFQAIAGAKFWAHGFVLAARYARCAAFFSSCYGRLSFVVESMPVQQGNAWPPVCDVVVTGLSSEMLELLVDLAYNIPINEREGLHNIREVLDVAESLNIASSTLNPQFKSLMPEKLSSVLYNDEIHAPNEVECAFGAVLKWITGNVEESRCHLPRLVALIKFAFCSREDMAKIESDPLVRARVATVYWRTRPDHSEWRWLKPRFPKDGLFLFGGGTGGVTNLLLTYNCRSSRWLIQPHQDTPPRAYHGVAILDDLIYFVGGFDGHEGNHTVVTLDVLVGDWTGRSNMQVARCCISVAVLQGYLYAIGGFDGAERISSCE